MSERDDALRATTDDLIADAEELEALERRKASLEPDDPRQDALAVKAEALVRTMVPKAAAQREIVSGPEDDPGRSPERMADPSGRSEPDPEPV
jgi:hypothetical protein